MEGIKGAFFNVKEDILKLNKEMAILKNELKNTNMKMLDVCNIMLEIKEDFSSIRNESIPDRQTDTSTDNSIIQTDNSIIQTDKGYINNRKDHIWGISTGNQGVQTDRQTDNSTDRQMEKEGISASKYLDNTINLLDSLDSMKKEIRLKFKKLTDKEVLVYSTIYQFDEEKGFSDYKSLSDKLNLSESSIRDYIGRILKKDMPLEKIKINNKQIHLKIPPTFKKIASLNTILKLRTI